MTSITPLSDRIPSSRAGSASTRPDSFFKVASTAASTDSLTFTIGATPSRLTFSVPYTVPRARTALARLRAGISTASQPGGTRSRRSSPLALTDFSSHDQTYVPHTPWLRAKPVMLESAISLRSLIEVRHCESLRPRDYRWQSRWGLYRRPAKVTSLVAARGETLLLTVAPGPRCRHCCGSARRRGRLHFRRCRIGLRVLEHTQTSHVLEMLIVALGKDVTA